MNRIVVLSGSPKGQKSITLRYVNYLMKCRQDVAFEVMQISQRINVLEKKDVELRKIAESINAADGVIWAFPVYVYMVPSAYKRFLELMELRGLNDVFRGKHTAILTTSIHFFDNCAHEYLHAVCDDLDMQFCGSFSAAMDDLLNAQKRKQLETFFDRFILSIREQRPMPRQYQPVVSSSFHYQPQSEPQQHDLAGRKVLLITDAEAGSNSEKMTTQLLGSFQAGSVRVINLHETRINGGCLGCCRCAFDNVCVYGDSDDIRKIYEEYYPEADIILFAATIRDRFFSALWKRFIERRFMKTHQPMMTDKQFGVIVSGPLRQIPNIRHFIEADAGVSQANLVGIVTDECGNSALLDRLLSDFAADIAACATSGYTAPPTFPAVGGAKVFRDEIWGKLRFVFQADHRYFKSHGMYDFPQKDYKSRIKSSLMMLLLSIPKVRDRVRSQLKDFMLKPYEKAGL